MRINFTIRDALWLVVVIGLLFAVAIARSQMRRMERSTGIAVPEVRAWSARVQAIGDRDAVVSISTGVELRIELHRLDHPDRPGDRESLIDQIVVPSGVSSFSWSVHEENDHSILGVASRGMAITGSLHRNSELREIQEPSMVSRRLEPGEELALVTLVETISVGDRDCVQLLIRCVRTPAKSETD